MPNVGDWADAIVAAHGRAPDDPANAGIRREPELPDHEEIAPRATQGGAASSSLSTTNPTTMRSALAQCSARSARSPARRPSIPADDMGL